MAEGKMKKVESTIKVKIGDKEISLTDAEARNFEMCDRVGVHREVDLVELVESMQAIIDEIKAVRYGQEKEGAAKIENDQSD